ncbi:Voltage-dependent calcium channel subunit alpha-2/delta-2 [Pelomyxa schiedti]|nr:Voltage-dependent calcium channel subunit alpha-2/delta-2 [Pelomyxa schiedti]
MAAFTTTSAAATPTRVVVVLGPPGSGKGTQCKKLQAKLGLVHVSTGDIFRDAVMKNTPLGRKVAPYVNRSDFVPDNLVVELIRDRIARHDCVTRGVLLDGFPRTLHQTQELLSHVNVERAVVIQVDDDQCIKNMLGRKIDVETGDIYHTEFFPPPNAIHASRLVQRRYDIDEESARLRLRAFHAQLGLIVPCFAGKVQAINGQRKMGVVFKDFLKMLNTPLSPLSEPAAAPPRTSRKKKAKAPPKGKCAVCLTEDADFLVVPCGHQCGCKGCLTAINESTAQCPICRSHISGLIQVYSCGVIEEEPEGLNMEDVDMSFRPITTATATTTTASAGNRLSADQAADGWGDEVSETAHEEVLPEDLVELQVSPCITPVLNQPTPVAVTVRIPDLLTRTPVDICCCVDVSGSMGTEVTYRDDNGNVIQNDGLTVLDIVKHTVSTVIHLLGDDDRLGIVVFDDNASTVLPLTQLDAPGRAKAMDAASKLVPLENTNMWAGMLEGMEVLRTPPGTTTSTSARKKFLLVLTDGQPNIIPPKGHIPELRAYMEKHPDFKFQINTFGVGYELDSELLVSVASEGGGTFAFIPDAKLIGTCIVNCVANAVTTTTQQASLHLMLKGGATFAGPVLGGTSVKEVTWGRVVSVGALHLGQVLDVVVPVTIPAKKGDYLEAVLVWANSKGKEVRVSAVGNSRNITDQSVNANTRCNVIDKVSQIIKAGCGRTGKSDMENLRIDTDATRQNHSCDLLEALYADVNGRMSKAVNQKARYDRWGRHYLRALVRAHQVQVCTNMLDPGLQLYGGSLFKQNSEAGGKIFITLPPPVHGGATQTTTQATTKKKRKNKKSNTTATTATSASAPPPKAPTPPREPTPPVMETYYGGGGGGCFAGDCTVHVHNVGETRIDQLRKGDIVLTSGSKLATVICIISLKRTGPLVMFPGGLKITPHHPALLHGSWRKPSSMVGSPGVSEVENPSGVVYNLVLDSAHVLVVNGIACVTWGHNLKGNSEEESRVLYHSFYGTEKVVEALKILSSWESGFLQVEPIRHNSSGHTIGFSMVTSWLSG